MNGSCSWADILPAACRSAGAKSTVARIDSQIRHARKPSLPRSATAFRPGLAELAKPRDRPLAGCKVCP